MTNALSLIKKTDYCPTMGDWAVANGRRISASKMAKGDLALFDFNHNGTSDHIGIIEKVNKDGSFNCIEGNTSLKSNDNGGNVMRRTRYKYQLTDGKVVRPKYTDDLTADMVVATAVSQLGTKESPANSNRVKYNVWFYGSNVSAYWCCTFVCWCFAHTEAKAGLKPYSGEWPTFVISKTRTEVINDTITWARYIANNNEFHYGSGKAAHHNGCYFCGTQPSSKKHSSIKDYKKTYCCNPYIHAAFAHGGLIPSMLKMCRKGSSFGFKHTEGYAKSSLFKYIKHPDKSSLKAGDVMCSNTHVAIVTVDGGKKLAEAIHDDNKRNSNKWNGSISEKEMSKSKYNSFSRVYRLKSGYSNFKHIVQFGDVSDDVLKVQGFLAWYGVYKGTLDRVCGDKTHDAIKAYQKAEGLKVTGAFGTKNLAAAKKVKR